MELGGLGGIGTADYLSHSDTKCLIHGCGARLGSLNFSCDSPYEAVTSNWKTVGEDVVWSVTVPPNVMAMLSVASSRQYSMTLDGGAGYDIPAGKLPTVTCSLGDCSVAYHDFRSATMLRK
jgi:hypothetical protein